MTTRRNFIKQSGLIAAAAFISPEEILASKKVAGIQLYTLRDQIRQDAKGAIQKCASAGYKEVELYGYGAGKFFGMTVTELKALLKSLGLKSPSGHYTPAKFLFQNGEGDDVKELIDVARNLGHSYITIPYLMPDQRKTLDQYKKLAERMNKAGEMVKSAGLQLAYHNHDFEFQSMEGSSGYEIIMNETDPSLLKLEADLYWVVRAGQDPVELFKRQPGRFHMWHVKDMSKTDPTQNTEIGNGSIDYKKIFASAKLAGVRHYFVEQENNYVPDAFASIATSSNYLRKTLLK